MAFDSFSEYRVTKGASASNVNGGGPRFGANDGPTYALAAGANGATAVDNGANSDVTDLSGGKWGDTQVDDMLCFDTAGLKEFAMVMAIDVGANENLITVFPQLTAAAEKACNVCGAWKSVNHAAATAANATFTNAAADPIRVSIGPGTYAPSDGPDSDEVEFLHAGMVGQPITFEGYKTNPGDLDTGVKEDFPTIDGEAGALQAGTLLMGAGIDYLRVRNLHILAETASKRCISTSSDSSVFERLWLKATGTSAHALFITAGYYNYLHDIYVESAKGYGIYSTQGDCISSCHIQTAGTGIHAGSYSKVVNCIIEGITSGNCLEVGGNNIFVDGCIFYGCDHGSGIKVTSSTLLQVTNCIFDTMNQYAIEGSATTFITEAHNSFRSCSQGVRDANIRSDPVGNTTHGADPFVDAAGHDFSLNNNDPGGAQLRVNGFPGTMLDGTNIGYRDIGPLQHEESAGGGRLIDGGLVG